jgi:hypothetical protein
MIKLRNKKCVRILGGKHLRNRYEIIILKWTLEKEIMKVMTVFNFEDEKPVGCVPGEFAAEAG